MKEVEMQAMTFSSLKVAAHLDSLNVQMVIF